MPVALGELGVGREGEDFDAPAGALSELADGGGIAPDPVAPGGRQCGRVESQAQADGAREPRRVEDKDADRLFRALERADPGTRCDQRCDLDGERGLAHPTGKARDRDNAQAGEHVRDRRGSLVWRAFRVRTVGRRTLVVVKFNDPESDGALTHRCLLLDARSRIPRRVYPSHLAVKSGTCRMHACGREGRRLDMVRFATYLGLMRDFVRTHVPGPWSAQVADPPDEPAVRGLAPDREDRGQQDGPGEQHCEHDLDGDPHGQQLDQGPDAHGRAADQQLWRREPERQRLLADRVLGHVDEVRHR